MIVWIDAVAADSAPHIFGLSLVERHLHGLRNLKPAPTRVIIDLPAGAAELKLGDKRLYRLPLEWRQSGDTYAARLGQIVAAAAGAVLILDGRTIADPRLPAVLAARTTSTVVPSREAEDQAAVVYLVGDQAALAAALAANPV